MPIDYSTSNTNIYKVFNIYADRIIIIKLCNAIGRIYYLLGAQSQGAKSVRQIFDVNIEKGIGLLNIMLRELVESRLQTDYLRIIRK